MPKNPDTLIQEKIKILDEISIWDQREQEWTRAWERRYKRVKTFTAIKNITFDATTTTKTSEIFYCEPYSKFAIAIDLDVTLTPTDILFEIFFSDDNIKFYKLMNGPFGDLRYEDSDGDLKELIHGECHGTWAQVKATATGTSAANKFTVTAKLIFSN